MKQDYINPKPASKFFNLAIKDQLQRTINHLTDKEPNLRELLQGSLDEINRLEARLDPQLGIKEAVARL